ncbi:MAG: hypothetical protein AAF922_11775, partial [Pseudomonadota bacterium]
MARKFKTGTSALAFAVAGVFVAGTAQADLTAADVWTDWQGYLASSGYSVTASQSQSGDTLTVSDITLSLEVPGEEGPFTVEMGELSFVENNDGTVSVLVPESLPMRFSGQSPEEGEVNVVMEYTSSGFDMIASGEPDDLLYNYSADEVGFSVTGIDAGGETLDIGKMAFALGNVIGVSEMKTGDLRKSIQRLASETLSYTIDVTDPEEGGTVFVQSEFAGLDVTATGAVPTQVDMTDMAVAIDAGFEADANFTFASGQSQIRIEDAEQTFTADTRSDGGSYDVTLGQGGLSY